MITIVNWYDFALLVGPFILWIVVVIGYDEDSDSNILPICLFVVGGLCFLGSMFWSIIANKGSLFNMIVAVFAKLFVVMIVWLIVLFIFRVRTTKKQNMITDNLTQETLPHTNKRLRMPSIEEIRQ
jgi:amino acid permease